MSHGKMYREISGYEDALYDAGDIIDIIDEVKDLIRYGKPKQEILEKLTNVERLIEEIRISLHD